MKKYLKIIIFIGFISWLSTACEKKIDSLPYYPNGNAPVLSSSVSSTTPLVKDSSKIIFVVNWTDPMYSTKSVNYTVQLDTSNSFTNSVSFSVSNVLTDSFTASQLNNILLNNYLLPFNVARNVYVRVKSAYSNNNEQYTSNTLLIKMTPYYVPPKVTPPSVLYMVGAATQNGWSNPVPDSTQKFYQTDLVTFVGVFKLNGGQQFLLLPVYGSWDYKYAVIDATASGIVDGKGGSFGYYTTATPTAYNTNIPAPATDGWYKVVVDFQHGIYTITPYTSTFPTNLYIVGDATADSWNNSNPPVNPVFTQLDAANFQLTMPLIGGKSFLLLPTAGSWANKYAVDNSSVPSSGGSFGYNLSTNFNAPATSGTYTITANFFDFTFTVK